MGRIYKGFYKVRIVFDTENGEQVGYIDPLSYEECEFLCLMFGAGYLYKYGKNIATVKRAQIIGPVSQ